MNCLECRRRLLIDPADRDDGLLRHLNQCEQCTREAERIWVFEKKLRSALGAKEPMESDFGTSSVGRRKSRTVPRHPRRWARAAGLVLSLGLGTWFGHGLFHDGDPGSSDLAATVIDHIEDEIDHLQVNHRVTADGLADLLAPYGANLSGELDPVRYAGRCWIRRFEGVHLVMQVANGPVTVLLMPGEYLKSPEQVESSRFSGLLLPTEFGSMAVVGEGSESVEPVVNRITRLLSWES